MKKLLPAVFCGSLALVTADAFAACVVPETVEGLQFLNIIDPAYSPANPNAGNLVRLDLAKDTYRLSIINIDKQVTGSYSYTRLSERIGQFQMQENYDDATTIYHLTFVCLSDKKGTLVFTQDEGPIKPDVRQNTGRYHIVSG